MFERNTTQYGSRTATMTVRRAEERGRANFGWLDSRHTFSFGEYLDPEHMGFRALRVINDDRVAPGGGFPSHPHRNMEILTYVLEGALEHEDSMGNGSVIRPGDVQLMSAGTGVVHSEYNHSREKPVHFLQIWIIPDRDGHRPGYEQKAFAPESRRGQLRLVASADGADGSLSIHQDARLYATLLAPGEKVEHELAPGRHAWVQVARGAIALNGTALNEGDGASISNVDHIALEGTADAEVLLFDLA